MPKKHYLLIILLMPVLLWAQEQTYTVTGKIGNYNSPTRAYLAYKKEGKNLYDSVDMKNGAFSFSGTLNEPMYAALVIDHAGQGVMNLPRGADMLKLYIDKGVTKITGADSARLANISGSKVTMDFVRLSALINPVLEERNELIMRQRAAPEPYEAYNKKYDQLSEQAQQLRRSYVENNPHSYISLQALWDYAGDFRKAADLENLFGSLSDSLQQTFYGQKFRQMMENVSLIKIGLPAPEFVQADPQGNAVKFSSFRGKYVLIDFWASWCGPCRAENPLWVRVYNKYKGKNFTILGVSLDKHDGKNAWINAIKKDGLEWQQVSDLKGWENEAGKLYGVRAIPQNFLVDPEGKIIAYHLTSGQLERMLEKLL